MQDFDEGEMVANDNRRAIVGGKAAMEGNVVVSHTEQHGTARHTQAVDGQGVPLDGVEEQHDARAQARRQQEENETQRHQREQTQEHFEEFDVGGVLLPCKGIHELEWSMVGVFVYSVWSWSIIRSHRSPGKKALVWDEDTCM